MSNAFIGLTMLVTLSSPPGAQLRGVVSGIEPGKSLTLRNVTCPANGKYVPEFTINAAEIVELIEARNENTAPSATVKAQKTIPVAPAERKTFEDPAILSVGKRPTPNQNLRPNIPAQWNSAAMERTDSARTATGREKDATRDITPAATLVEPMQKVHIKEEVDDGLVLEELDAAQPEPEVSPEPELQPVKARRTRRRKGRKNDEGSHDPASAPTKETTRSKGWRQTPLLEPVDSFQPFATLKKNQKGKMRKEMSGWATEDATDVQEMGDFDFENNLAKFDKRTVFNQIQAEDSVADEDRLVAHNRLPKAKPGTSGGKNLHYTENVLDAANGNGKAKGGSYKSEADSDEIEERASQRGSGSGRHSRRAESKLSTSRRPVSRKGSAGMQPLQPARTLSMPTNAKALFYLVPSDRRCEPISSLQMLNLENIADNELGLSEDMMTENAARGIAEVALSALHTRTDGLNVGNNVVIPTVVVFAGNNKSGLRAVAAARHLRNHGASVVVCVLGLERESELLVGLRRQIKVFRSFGGKAVTKSELLEFIKNLASPVELVIDGLLGLTISFEELRTGDQATAYELIAWANRSKAEVLAIDVPTGIDPTTGKVSIIDGRQLYIHANYVVAMAAPKKGLLEAMALGEGIGDEDAIGKGREWQLYVADLGLGASVWKKAGTRVRRGVEFEGSWVLGMRFESAE
ncbi:YjeF N-terminal domain-like protein [Mollisia scopiformis]|uniref:Enhancer of mRNA-decapping protein 3 n=1 Tax=Mollisia scopiformis TaxID=149040 RepID=A0A194XP92_MOLSC|nr:YjeF N-terminal domain-like protein [Mollisia scopiformis]KUJ21981.1 YjeF N-terminal domain-like protein [Mollisia scopiformis]